MDTNQFILSKLEKIDEKVDDIKIHAAKQSVTLEETKNNITKHSELLKDYNQSLQDHMKRTSILETEVKGFHTDFDPIRRDFLDDKAVMKYNATRLKKAMMWMGAVSTALGIIYGIIKFMDL